MKQHITQNQIDELSKDAHTKLTDWMTSKTYLLYGQTLAYKPLSIGQMIEFLDEHDNEELGSVICTLLSFYAYPDDHSQFVKGFESENLCDALWEAMVEILEKGSL